MITANRKKKIVEISNEDERLLKKVARQNGHNTLKPYLEHLLHVEAQKAR